MHFRIYLLPMALQLDSVFDDVFDDVVDQFDRLIGGNLVDQVTDFFKQIDLGKIDLGDFFGDLRLDGLVDGLLNGLDSFFGDFNLVKLFNSVDSTLGGVDLLGVDFDGLLKGFVGDLSVNQVLKDLDSLVGNVTLNNLFDDDSIGGNGSGDGSGDDLTGDALSRFARQVRDIAGDLFDDILTGGFHILAGDRTSNLLKGVRTSDFLSGYRGSDDLLGLGGDDILLGDRGQDQLYGGRGSDILVGGLGKDWLAGGQGNDTFVLKSGAGHALITDFQVGRDAIALLGNLAFGNLSLTQQGISLLIRNGDDLLAILPKVGSTALSLADFMVP